MVGICGDGDGAQLLDVHAHAAQCVHAMTTSAVPGAAAWQVRQVAVAAA
jgi:hypothetical protein